MQVLSEKKASYSCFLETCNSKYWNADERREHCIKSHGFPANFKFDSRNHKKAKRDQQKKSSKQQSNNNRANKKDCHHEKVEMMDQDDVKASQQPPPAKGISTNIFFGSSTTSVDFFLSYKILTSMNSFPNTTCL